MDALHGPFYEIWNEPDLPAGTPHGKVFFTGGPADYSRLCSHAAPQIKEADGDSLVGGPAVAWQTDYFKAILDAHAPIDLVSIHSYDNFQTQIGLMRQAIASSPNEHLRATLPIFLTPSAAPVLC